MTILVGRVPVMVGIVLVVVQGCPRSGDGLLVSAWGMRTLVIVDDHDGFRAAARELLNTEGFFVVGEACDAETAVEVVSRLCPDVVLLDVMLCGADGFAVIDMLAEAGQRPQTVLISSRSQATFTRRLARSPARGFISKPDLSGAALEALLTP